MPLKRFVLLHVIKRTSRTLPTLEKNSSKSRARTRCDNCIQKMVRASRSSSSVSSSDRSYRRLAEFGGVRPRRNGRRGDGDFRRRSLERFGSSWRFSLFFSGDRLRFRSFGDLLCRQRDKSRMSVDFEFSRIMKNEL